MLDLFECEDRYFWTSRRTLSSLIGSSSESMGYGRLWSSSKEGTTDDLKIIYAGTHQPEVVYKMLTAPNHTKLGSTGGTKPKGKIGQYFGAACANQWLHHIEGKNRHLPVMGCFRRCHLGPFLTKKNGLHLPLYRFLSTHNPIKRSERSERFGSLICDPDR